MTTIIVVRYCAHRYSFIIFIVASTSLAKKGEGVGNLGTSAKGEERVPSGESAKQTPLLPPLSTPAMQAEPVQLNSANF